MLGSTIMRDKRVPHTTSITLLELEKNTGKTTVYYLLRNLLVAAYWVGHF